eukprot:TRINITY_DN2389_c0_g1_i1.p1 TRINITY_DN2389_c0_g1~~TRINITY_DN2389_c0_g1_i1.p1  ORF type:complete len:576 (-),score=250.62 TRINITY_DN2389_c0_g1_i1:245-1972(-)
MTSPQRTSSSLGALTPREQAQAKALHLWIDYILSPRNQQLKSFPDDISNGVGLIRLYEALSRVPIGKRFEENPRLAIHRTNNISLALERFKADGVKFSASAESIEKGDLKLIVGLLASIAQLYQIGEPSSKFIAKLSPVLSDYHLELEKPITKGSSDGKMVSAVVHSRMHEEFDLAALDDMDAAHKLEYVFKLAESKSGVPRMITPDEIVNSTVDEFVLTLYLSLFLSAEEVAPKIPAGQSIEELQKEIESLKKQMNAVKSNQSNEILNAERRLKLDFEKEKEASTEYNNKLLQEAQSSQDLSKRKLREAQEKIKSLESQNADLRQMLADSGNEPDPELERQRKELEEKTAEYNATLAKMKEIEDEKNRLQQELIDAKEKHEKDMKRFEEIESERTTLSDQIADLKKKLEGEVEEGDQLKSRLIVLTEQQNRINDESKEIMSRRANVDKKNKETAETIKRLEKEKDEAEKKAQKAMEAVQKAKAEQEELMKKMKKKLEDENKLKAREREENKELKKENTGLKDENKRLRARRDTYKKKYRNIRKESGAEKDKGGNDSDDSEASNKKKGKGKFGLF